MNLAKTELTSTVLGKERIKPRIEACQSSLQDRGPMLEF